MARLAESVIERIKQEISLVRLVESQGGKVTYNRFAQHSRKALFIKPALRPSCYRQ